MKMIEYFTKDLPQGQKQYEALRAVAFQEGTIEEVAERFGYKPRSLRALENLFKRGKLTLFPKVPKGPKGRRTDRETTDLIVQTRREKKLSSREIVAELRQSDIAISVRTVERILTDAGFPKLRRRTFRERGISKKGLLIPERSANLEPGKLEPFRVECKAAGAFFFLPYILESGVLDVARQCALPESDDIGKTQAVLSMLLLKLIGTERVSHIDKYNADLGFGLFAGLNVLPKPTYMISYSCRTEASVLLDFQQRIIENFRRLFPDIYQSKTINLDFHSIPHFGEESEMEKVWCGARGKALKGANTFFAQDGESDLIIYSRADIKRKESSEEILNFVDYWLKLKGNIDETLVFDSKLTRYDILHELDEAGIRFITLRIRRGNLVPNALKIPESDWERIYLPIPKRKRKYVKVHESRIQLVKGRKEFRQIIVRDHGRSEPTFIITNDENPNAVNILTTYAKRWHIENKFAELVNFFSLNALSSPIMIRIHFDILFTVIADTLYHIFARDLGRFEKARAPSIFRHFIDAPGIIEFDGERFTVKIRKRAATPILLGVSKLNQDIRIPWLDNLPLRIVWTP